MLTHTPSSVSGMVSVRVIRPSSSRINDALLEEGEAAKPAISITAKQAGKGEPKPAISITGILAGHRSHCKPLAEAIAAKVGLSAQRIYQDLVEQNGFGDSYQSVQRFVRKLKATEHLAHRTRPSYSIKAILQIIAVELVKYGCKKVLTGIVGVSERRKVGT
jgi:hypothetical protein